MPPTSFAKPPHLGPLTEGYRALEDSCGAKYKNVPPGSSEADSEWRLKIREGYDRISQTLWHVASEFDVRGYGTALRDKLTSKWCDCGCSTDHLGEVCEKTVRDDERINGRSRNGKQREWDGRGRGVLGWETEDEEDVWEGELDFGPNVPPPPYSHRAHQQRHCQVIDFVSRTNSRPSSPKTDPCSGTHSPSESRPSA